MHRNTPYLDAASYPVSGFALGAKGPSLPITFEEFAIVGVEGDGVGIPTGLPIQRIHLRRETDPDSPF